MIPRLVVLLGAIALCAAGCGATDTGVAAQDGSPAERVAAAAEITSDADTFRSSFEIQATSGDEFVGTGEGEYQSEPSLARLTMEVAEGGETSQMSLLMTADELYTRIEAQDPPLDKWYAISKEEIAEEDDDYSDAFYDPRESLVYLRSPSAEVVEVGEEEVQGVQTTHYTMTANLEQAAERSDSPELERAIRRTIAATGVTEAPMEVWIDADGYVRRILLTIDGKDPAIITTELFDFGEDVAIEVPSDDEIFDPGDFMDDASTDFGTATIPATTTGDE